MSMAKRALASSSSGQPSQPKRLCVPPADQVWHRSEGNLVPRRWLAEEDVWRVLHKRKEKKNHVAAKESFGFHFLRSTESTQVAMCRSINRDALDRMMQLIASAHQKLEEPREHANIHFSHLGSANAESARKNDARNLRLQFRTKLSLPLFTGKKLEGEGGACISVALIDVTTGDVVTSGPESSIKLDVVVLEGDFNKDDEDDWAQEEFENYVVKEREGKGPLLTGDLRVKLRGGGGELGEIMFTDNSSWTRSKTFRIGLKVASDYCGDIQIREAKTDAFPVKEHRAEGRSFFVFLEYINN